MANTLKMLTSYCRIVLVDYGLVHRGDCINCETRYFCFDLAFVWPSPGHADYSL